MHVVHLSWEHPPRLFGGLGRHVGALTAALAGRGDLEVTVVTPALPTGAKEAEGSRVRVRRAAAQPSLPAEHWVGETLSQNLAMAESVGALPNPPDVVHVHDWMAFGALRALPWLRVPVVATLHATERGRHMGHLPPGVSRWVDAQEQALVARADHVVVCSAWMAGQVARQLGAVAENITVIGNAVDISAWTSAEAGRQGHISAKAGEHARRVVFAGRLEHEKGVHVLLEATDGLPCELVIAGDGTRAAQLRDAGVGRQDVRFVGQLTQPDLARLLATAAITVVPSLYEPFGLVALEAMAAGSPVVASEAGGLAEVVRGAGVLVPPGDATALATALRRLLDDAEERDRLRTAGADRAREHSWEDAAAAHVDLYCSLLTP